MVAAGAMNYQQTQFGINREQITMLSGSTNPDMSKRDPVFC